MIIKLKRHPKWCFFHFFMKRDSLENTYIVLYVCIVNFVCYEWTKKINTMGNLDFKQIAITIASVMVALVVYDRFVAPMIDKTVG